MFSCDKGKNVLTVFQIQFYDFFFDNFKTPLVVYALHFASGVHVYGCSTNKVQYLGDF